MATQQQVRVWELQRWYNQRFVNYLGSWQRKRRTSVPPEVWQRAINEAALTEGVEIANYGRHLWDLAKRRARGERV